MALFCPVERRSEMLNENIPRSRHINFCVVINLFCISCTIYINFEKKIKKKKKKEKKRGKRGKKRKEKKKMPQNKLSR